MKPAERERALTGIIAMAEELRADIERGRDAARRRTTAQARLRAADANGGGGGAGGPSDATGGAVADAENTRIEDRIDRWDMQIEDSYHLLSKAVVDVADMLRPPATPTVTQKPMRGCESCARDKEYFEPIDVDHYAKYCRFCGDFKAANGRVPPLGAVEHIHTTGKRVTSKVLAEAYKAERDRALANQPKRRSA